MSDNSTEIKIFISYAHRDRKLKEKLETHLSLLKRQGIINIWSDREILAGEDLNGNIATNLETSDIILMLISNNFLNSDYINNVEVKKAFELHQKGKLAIISVILSECDWEESTFGKFKALPEDGKPVTSKYWHSHNEALKNVVKGIKEVVKARKKDESKFIKKGTKKIRAPGGPLHPEAVNYIERSADKQLKVLLECASAPMFLIIGGIQCGKTSLLYRFLKKAEEKGSKVIHVDFRKLILTNKKPEIKDAFTYILEKTSEDLTGRKTVFEDEYDGLILEEWVTGKLKEIFEKNSKTGENFYLVIDSIDLLYAYLKNVEKTEPLINWLASMRNYQDSPPFDKLTVIAVMTILSYSSSSSHIASTLKTQAAIINLPNFGEIEIRNLLKLMGMETKIEENAKKIINLFGGHPHLSHIAVYELYSDIKFSIIQQSAFNLMGGYGSYWRRIKRMLEDVIQKKSAKYSIKSVLMALNSENKSPNEYRIIDKLIEELVILGIVEMNHQVSSVFVRKAIQKELE